MDSYSAGDNRLACHLFCCQLSSDQFRNRVVKPMPSSDCADGPFPAGDGADYRNHVFEIKISFDVICLAVTAGMTGIFLGHLDGLGAGTILAAFTMGKSVGVMGSWMDRHVRFTSFLSGEKLCRYAG